MSALLTGSYIALWILVIFLTLALAALARQIGILYRRLAPAGARIMNAGPTIGERIVPFTGRDIDGSFRQFAPCKSATHFAYVSIPRMSNVQ